MKFIKTNLNDAYLIELEEFKDNRGTFSRQFCKKELEEYGINFDICQCNISKNFKKNTLRGMHYQKVPWAEPKLVSCIKGAFYDVIVDLRENSSTYLKWQGFELTEDNNKILYVPPMFAHGFQTLVDNTVVYYQIGEFFQPDFYDGIRYNDPKIGIEWKELGEPVMNERDQNYRLL